MSAPETWLPISDAARAAGISAKALRRRIERGTVTSEMHDDGRRRVLLQSIDGDDPAPAPGNRGTPLPRQLEELLRRVEELAAENGRLRALTQIAESTEQRLADELHQERARVRQLEAIETQLAAAGPIRAWRLARQHRRVMDRPAAS